MRKISIIEQAAPDILKTKRTAAYARVSRETERLSHSISAQISYYDNLIRNHPGWEYAGVYADWGISGTDVKKREGFQRMIADCEAGKIDIVLTKSISRFARNTVDLLETVRHLKALNVEVRFEKEHINSLSGDGELMLSILASFAQEESRSVSENIKWGIRKRYQSGEIGVKNKQVFGYRYDGERYVIVPKEAEIVEIIFEKYIAGMTLRNMVRLLDEMGAETRQGCRFSYSSIQYILHNEIYCGDRLLQKCFVEDPIRHNKVSNRGQLPQYYIRDCHQPVIDRETFARARKEARRRAAGHSGKAEEFCFHDRRAEQ